jgi:hypothetical protein
MLAAFAYRGEIEFLDDDDSVDAVHAEVGAILLAVKLKIGVQDDGN